MYNASKDQGEQAFWKFIKECKPGFVGNTVLPDVILGLPLNPAKQGLGPTATMCKTMWDDDASGPWKLFYPQWVIDIEDTTLLHVAGLVHPELKGERIMGYAHNKRWTDFIQRLQKMYPEHKFPGKFRPDDRASFVQADGI